MTDFSPREIVSELDRFIIGQSDAKRAVAIALRNRWRRQQLDDKLREEVLPKNILMIGPTGVGKTEISRRLGKARGARRSSRSRPPNSPKSAMSAATSSRSCAIWWRSRSRRRASANARTCRRARSWPPKSVSSLRWSVRIRAPPPGNRSAASCAPASSTIRKSRSRCRPPAAACRCLKSPACRARRWARSRSATFSASSAAAAARPGASPSRNRTIS